MPRQQCQGDCLAGLRSGVGGLCIGHARQHLQPSVGMRCPDPNIEHADLVTLFYSGDRYRSLRPHWKGLVEVVYNVRRRPVLLAGLSLHFQHFMCACASPRMRRELLRLRRAFHCTVCRSARVRCPWPCGAGCAPGVIYTAVVSLASTGRRSLFHTHYMLPWGHAY